MIHGYHVIWSVRFLAAQRSARFVVRLFPSWELARFGAATRSAERLPVDLGQWNPWRASAQEAWKFPPVVLSGEQARSVGGGFGNGMRKSRFAIWACSILPEHVHLILGRHRYGVEQIANLLKREATKPLTTKSLHPQARYRQASGKLPSMWAERPWKVYLDNETAIENAIRHVEENPVKEGKPRQRWSFVAPD
jgi:REP element-mobilizing transposase RayT